MLEVGLHRVLVCDNGKSYTICEGNEFYDYKLREESWFKEVNMVDKCYLEDAIKFDQTICVGRLENGNPENAKIIDIKDSYEDKVKARNEAFQKIINDQIEMSNGIREFLVGLKSAVQTK